MFGNFLLKHEDKNITLYLISGDSGPAPRSPKDSKFQVWVIELYILKQGPVSAHGLIDSDKFNYVCDIFFFLKDTEWEYKDIFGGLQSLHSSCQSRKMIRMKKIICFCCTRESIMSGYGHYSLPCWNSFSNREILTEHPLDCRQRPHCMALGKSTRE